MEQQYGSGIGSLALCEAAVLPFESVEVLLLRSCNEFARDREVEERPLPESLKQEALCIWRRFRDLASVLLTGPGQRAELQQLAEEWSLLLSRLQAEALDRAGVPHPPVLLPVTEEQHVFWYCLATEIECLPAQELEDPTLLSAVSEEWTAAATIAEAVRIFNFASAQFGCRHGSEPLRVAVLGPSPSLEYSSKFGGVEALEQKLALALVGDNESEVSLRVHMHLCGPDVPEALHGRRGSKGACDFRHSRALWHEMHKAEGEASTPADVVVALNAGTSVREHTAEWKDTLSQFRTYETCLLFFTGYTLPEAEDTWNDISELCPEAVKLGCEVNPSATLQGFDRVELGVTPCSYPGKSNYAYCCAWLDPAGLDGVEESIRSVTRPRMPHWPIQT